MPSFSPLVAMEDDSSYVRSPANETDVNGGLSPIYEPSESMYAQSCIVEDEVRIDDNKTRRRTRASKNNDNVTPKKPKGRAKANGGKKASRGRGKRKTNPVKKKTDASKNKKNVFSLEFFQKKH